MPAGKGPRYRGWPRKKLVWDDGETRRMLPNLWIGGKHQEEGDWITFQEGREKQAIQKRLCVVCGERMDGTIVLGRMNGKSDLTDGPGAHPRCMVVAVASCPHFTRGRYEAGIESDTRVAWRYDGPHSGHDFQAEPYTMTMTSMSRVDDEATNLTYADLRALAKKSPLGI